MLSDRIGAKVRGSQDAPPLSMAEKLLFAFCAAALVFVCLAGYTELDRQGKARAALTQVKAAQLAARKADKKDHFAFGPFLCVGIVLALLFGDPVLAWYCRFL